MPKCRPSITFITDKEAHWKCPDLSKYSELMNTTNKLVQLNEEKCTNTAELTLGTRIAKIGM